MKTAHVGNFVLVILTSVLVGLGMIATAGASGMNETAQKCLDCHGDYQDLVDKEPFYQGFDYQASNEGRVKINPHKYWPHEEKGESGVPDCTKCHTPHKEDIESAAEVVKANVEACFTCHHQKMFDSCTGCHPE